ncbi:phasin family protein [Skermanella rosea]|uniref:phasin family protein n=1 Tax=Skermanella rosea TaxID=1817965 RepID=UPI0019329723|nr:phasin family protein [Skermanella rosea]UEM02836.1 phasin family protein [Skermanella rosea]
MITEGPLPRLQFKPRRRADGIGSRPAGGFGRLLTAGGAAALAMGGAAAVAALAGGRKEPPRDDPAEEAGPAAEQSGHADGAPQEDGGGRLGSGAARLAGQAAEHLQALRQGPDNLTLSLQQASRAADTLLDCQDILAGSGSEIWREYLGYARRTVGMNLAHARKLAHCRSPQTMVSLQADLMVRQVDLTLQLGLLLADLSARATSRTVHAAAGKSRRHGS